MNVISALDTLTSTIKGYETKTKSKYKKEAYIECLDAIENLINDIKDTELAKLLALGEKFDVDHMNYSVISQRGHLETPTEYHKYLSQFSTREIDYNTVLNLMDEEHKEKLVIDVTKDKENIEALVAYRHRFDYITHRKGHDGIDPDNNVYEVKNVVYKRPKNDGRFPLSIKFDRLSENTYRKLNEGRPEIILNCTDEHKLLVEMKVQFTDLLVETYKQKLQGVKDKSTSGCSIAFADFKHAITDVTFISSDIEDYKLSLDLLEFINETKGTQFNTDRKSTMCPRVTSVLEDNSEYIKLQHTTGIKMAALARELSTKETKITGQHIKRVLDGKH